MIAVTTEDMERAEAEAVEAGRALAEAERVYASNRTSTGAYEAHQEAVGRADHAAVRVRVLREEFAEQQAGREARAAAGEAAAQRMTGKVEELAASRERAVAAVVEASEAMARALAALEAHDALVRAVGAELEQQGLRSVDGEATAANLDGSARIAGVKWPLVDAGGVLARCLVEEVARAYPRHPLAQTVVRPYGGLSAWQGRDVVLGLVRAKRGR
ncbi:hypothetical protein AB0C88_16185 [Streptomyces chartreusis]|uniref:hypothetical protein n=1 Tax=Streptomyces chartreusis TaxID=1969 RepID=UPI0034100BB1